MQDTLPQVYYLDVDYETDKVFGTDTPIDFHVYFDKQFLSNFGDRNMFIITLVSYNIVRDVSYVPPVNKRPLYLWSDLKSGCSSEFIALLNYDVSDNAQSNQFFMDRNPENQLINFKLYFNKRQKDTTQPWLQPTPAIDKIINVLLRFKIEIYKTI